MLSFNDWSSEEHDPSICFAHVFYSGSINSYAWLIFLFFSLKKMEKKKKYVEIKQAGKLKITGKDGRWSYAKQAHEEKHLSS